MPAAAAAARMRFLGLTPPNSAPTASERPGVKRSSAAIHFGSGASSPGCGRFRNPRHARNSSTTPSAIFSRVTAVRGPLESAASAASVSRSAPPPTTARASSQPPRNAGPLVRARGVVRMRITATMASGLMAMPIARGSISPIAPPTVLLRRRVNPIICARVTPSDAQASPLLESHRSRPADSQQIPRFERYNCLQNRAARGERQCAAPRISSPVSSVRSDGHQGTKGSRA